MPNLRITDKIYDNDEQWRTQNFTMEGVKIQPTLYKIFKNQYQYQLHMNAVY